MKNKKNIFVQTIIEEIKKNKRLPKIRPLILEDILYKDENNKTLLEYMLENAISYQYNLIPNISSSFEASKIFYRFNKLKELPNLNNKVYFTKEEDKYFIEKLLDIKEIDEIRNLSFEYDFRLIQIFEKYNRKDLLNKIKINQSNLLSNINEKQTLIEYIIEHNLLNDIIIPKFESESNIFEILKRIERMDVISSIPFTEEQLFNNNLIDKIISLNYQPNLLYAERKTIDYLYKIDRPDLLVNMFLHEEKINNLFMLVTPKETIIEYLLKSNNPNINYRYLALNVDKLSNEDFIDTYLLFTKYNKLEYLYSFSQNDLLDIKYKDSSLLDLFLERNPDLTKKMIEYFKLDTDIDIILYFKLKGIEFETKHGIDFDILDDEAYAEEYLNKQNQQLKNNIDYSFLTEEEITLLMELEELLIDENNKSIIDTIVLSYALQLSAGNENALIELRKIVQIIKENRNIKVQKSKNYSCFNSQTGLSINISNINNINHELGHLFHYYLANEETPQELENILNKIKKDESIKNKINLLSKTLRNKMKNLEDEISIEYDEWSKKYLSEFKTKEIEEFIEMSKESKIEHFLSLGYTQEELNVILDESYTTEQYLSNQKRIKCEEMCNNILISYYSELMAICDIIDAIFQGDFYNSKLKTQDNKEIKGVFGHGIGYYYSQDIVFQEIIANYSSLIKSDRKEEALSLLKTMVGSELIDLLNNFYQNKMINSDNYNLSYTL